MADRESSIPIDSILEISDSKEVFRLVSLIIESNLLNIFCNTETILKTQKANWIFDSVHLSVALHTYLAAKRQFIELPLQDQGPIALETVSSFHVNNILGRPQIAEFKKASRHLFQLTDALQFLKKGHYHLGNLLAQLRNRIGLGLNLYGGLYNVDIKWSVHSILMTIRYGILHGGYRVETGQFQNAFKARFASKDGFVPNLERRKSLESAIGELLRSHSCVDWERASKYIAQSIPYSHFEMRGQLLRKSAEWSTKYKASKIYSAIAWMSDSFFVGLAALQSEINNAKLIGIQHGGYYGYAKVHSHVFNTEYQFLDEFVSWGWDSRETVFGNISAKIIPFGSIHLRNISKGSNVNSHLGRPKNLPILFVVGPFNRIAFKCEFYFSYETFLKEVFPNNALALSRVAVSTKKDIHVKGSGDIFTDSNYISIVEKHCQIASVETETLNFNLRAFDLFHSYSIVCFDTLGTGFFEAIRAGVVAFLLPSARISPVMESTVKPSELFFLDPNTDLDFDALESRFQTAVLESEGFLKTYGKVAEGGFFDLISKKS